MSDNQVPVELLFKGDPTQLLKTLKELREEYKLLRKQISETSDINELGKLNKKAQDLQNSMKALTNVGKETKGVFEGLTGSIAKMALQWIALEKAVSLAADTFQDALKYSRENERQMFAASVSAKAFGYSQDELQKSIAEANRYMLIQDGDTAKYISRLLQAGFTMKQSVEIIRNLTITASTFGDTNVALTDKLDQATAAIQKGNTRGLAAVEVYVKLDKAQKEVNDNEEEGNIHKLTRNQLDQIHLAIQEKTLLGQEHMAEALDLTATRLEIVNKNWRESLETFGTNWDNFVTKPVLDFFDWMAKHTDPRVNPSLYAFLQNFRMPETSGALQAQFQLFKKSVTPNLAASSATIIVPPKPLEKPKGSEKDKPIYYIDGVWFSENEMAKLRKVPQAAKKDFGPDETVDQKNWQKRIKEEEEARRDMEERIARDRIRIADQRAAGLANVFEDAAYAGFRGGFDDFAKNYVMQSGVRLLSGILRLGLSSAFGGSFGVGDLLGHVFGFADGVERIKGPGTTTSDSILARLSRDESVMNAPLTHHMQRHGLYIPPGEGELTALNRMFAKNVSRFYGSFSGGAESVQPQGIQQMPPIYITTVLEAEGVELARVIYKPNGGRDQLNRMRGKPVTSG